jgi:hypothetical protein
MIHRSHRQMVTIRYYGAPQLHNYATSLLPLRRGELDETDIFGENVDSVEFTTRREGGAWAR